MPRRNKKVILENKTIEKYAAEGKSLFRHEGKVVFVPHVIPGDVVKVYLKKNKKDFAEGVLMELEVESDLRQKPFCPHFGACGGCQWQMLTYQQQLMYKEAQVKEQMTKIGKLESVSMQPIIGSLLTENYRNKMEFTFSNKQYLRPEQLNDDTISNSRNVLGLHARGFFDKIVEVDHCYLETDRANQIRNFVGDFCESKGYTYYDFRLQQGFLRNLVIRETRIGEIMVNLVTSPNQEDDVKSILDALLQEFHDITSVYYTINPKTNDSILDLRPILYHGAEYIVERLGSFQYIISPKSFFQTNSSQAEILYTKGLEMAKLNGSELLYDLYCGTGSIGIFMSEHVSRIVGVELVDDAIRDAKINAKLNGVDDKCDFIVGDAVKLCDSDFFDTYGKPDIVVVDPPRVGLMPALIDTLIALEVPKILYISCNPATQARDLMMLSSVYEVVDMCPVDMFPQTHHIENIAMLKLISNPA